MDFDVIVIGSGFGGAVTACRLAEANQRVLVLERGRRWQRYPRGLRDAWLWDHKHPERHNGWLDMRVFPNMSVVQGSGVGGGSLIYANISTEAPSSVFSRGWPREISYDELKPYYDRAGAMLKVQRVPEAQWPARTVFMKRAAESVGHKQRFQPLELAVSFDEEWRYSRPDCHDYSQSKRFINEHGVEQGTCVHCGLCDLGCPVRAKNTLDVNYIPRAERYNADVRELHQVCNIEPLVGGYRVSFDRLHDGQRKPGSASAPRVVLAAGSLGSTELLLRCKLQTKSLPRLSARLGKGWSSNGDFLTPSIHRERVSPTLGPTITSAINFLDGEDAGQSYWVQDGGFFDLLGPMLLSKRHRLLAKHTRAKLLLGALELLVGKRDPLAHVMPWFGQAVDGSDGEMSLSRRIGPFGGELQLHWDVEASLPAMNALIGRHKQLAHAMGGVPLITPSWSALKDLITPHPLGGCGMGDDAKHGVVDHSGEVFGYPGLFVADGSIFPRAIGVNPSRTIAALAERIADHMKASVARA
jgi:cholesterol oxidase